jgi:hypothetical protein
MEFVGHAAIRSQLAVRGYDRRITLGYVALAIVALAAVYFASGGPGITEGQLAIATVFP